MQEKLETCRNSNFTSSRRPSFGDNINVTLTAKNTAISPNFLVWKYCGKARFPHGFRRFARNYAEAMPFLKISTPEN